MKKFLTALLVDDAVREKAKAVVAHARMFPTTLRDMMDIQAHPERAPGHDQKRVLEIPMGWKVVYTLEQQPHPAGWCVHLSISCVTPDGEIFPPPREPVEEVILPLLDLTGQNPFHFYEEKVFSRDGKHRGIAVNLLFKYQGTPP